MVTMLVLTQALSGYSQVDDIKTASRTSSEKGSGGGSSAGSAIAVDIMLNSVSILAEWQRVKLQQSPLNPRLVSIEASTMVTTQPSSYYIIHPRVRGNWGIFSTDFRLNYIIEEGIDGARMIRTSDWQVLELNIVSSPTATFYIGGGFITEAFEARTTNAEFSAALAMNPKRWPVGVRTEYRFSEPRLEWSAQIVRVLLDRDKATVEIGAGALWQQYYDSIDLWGFQAGLTVRLF